MKNLIVTLLISVTAFAARGGIIRVFVDGAVVKAPEDITVAVKDGGDFFPKRYDERDSLVLQNGASLILEGKESLLPGKHGTVEMRFSPRNFRMNAAKHFHLELRPVRDCFIHCNLSDDIWSFQVTKAGITKRHWIPVYSWHNDGSDVTKLQQTLTVSVGFKGVNIYLDGRRAQTIECSVEEIVKPDRATFLLASAAPFEFISLYATEAALSKNQVIDRYISLQSKKKILDRPFVRVPRSRKPMSKTGPPQKSAFDDATALCGMSDVFSNRFIQGDLQYFLKYDEHHFYILSIAPVAAKRRLGFFAMLKYTETFDYEHFTLDPWKPLAGAGATPKWFMRVAVENDMRLSEAWVDSFASFGVDVPRPGVTWDVNFSNWSSPQDVGEWYRSDVKNIKSYGLIEFGGDDDLFARLLVPPEFIGNELRIEAGCVNPSDRERNFDFTCELFTPDGEIISLETMTGTVSAASSTSNILSLATGSNDTMLLKVILRDDLEKIFYLRTFVLKKNYNP